MVQTHHPLLLPADDDALVFLLEPVDGVRLRDELAVADLRAAAFAAGDAATGAGQHDVEVHAVDADLRVVLDAQVDVLVDAEPEVAVLGEVACLELVLLDLQTLLEDLLCLLTADGHVGGDLLVAADGEGADGVAGWKPLGKDGVSCFIPKKEQF